MTVKRKFLGLLFIMILLLPLSIANFATANPTPPQFIPMTKAYIQSNGTIEPPTLPIEKVDNHYFLTGDIFNYTIEIQCDDIIFDGNGYSVGFRQNGEIPDPYISKYGGPALEIKDRTNIIIRNVTFPNNIAGAFKAIRITNSSNIFVVENTAYTSLGVWMEYSNNCRVIGNNFQDSTVAFRNSSYVTIAYNNVSASYMGISLWWNKNINITRNELTANEHGIIVLNPSESNNIVENNFLDNDVGIEYSGAENLSATDTIRNNYWNGNGVDIQNIRDYGLPYDVGVADQGALSSPASTAFEVSLFALPSFQVTPSPTPATDSTLVSLTLLGVITVLVIVIICLLLYRKNKLMSTYKHNKIASTSILKNRQGTLKEKRSQAIRYISTYLFRQR